MSQNIEFFLFLGFFINIYLSSEFNIYFEAVTGFNYFYAIQALNLTTPILIAKFNLFLLLFLMSIHFVYFSYI